MKRGTDEEGANPYAAASITILPSAASKGIWNSRPGEVTLISVAPRPQVETLGPLAETNASWKMTEVRPLLP